MTHHENDGDPRTRRSRGIEPTHEATQPHFQGSRNVNAPLGGVGAGGLGREIQARPYKPQSCPMGLKPGVDVNRITHIKDETAEEEFVRKMGGDQ